MRFVAEFMGAAIFVVAFAIGGNEFFPGELDLFLNRVALTEPYQDQQEREQSEQTIGDLQFDAEDRRPVFGSLLCAMALVTLSYAAGVRGKFLLATILAAWGVFGLLLGLDPVSLVARYW